MANKPLNTTILDRAIVFAVRAHAGTERRGKGFPYIVHPMEAARYRATMVVIRPSSSTTRPAVPVWWAPSVSAVTSAVSSVLQAPSASPNELKRRNKLNFRKSYILEVNVVSEVIASLEVNDNR